MKCKICGDKINLTIFGVPDDICWGCYNNKEKVVEENIEIKKIVESKKTKLITYKNLNK